MKKASVNMSATSVVLPASSIVVERKILRYLADHNRSSVCSDVSDALRLVADGKELPRVHQDRIAKYDA